MTSSTLKFGPEWLRNLSDGSVSAIPSSSTASNSSASHGPSSQAATIGTTQKYKLADYRYGREEMLALFAGPIPVPENLKELKAILSDRLQQPLALQPETDDEQHLFTQPVNSTAVLRMTGRGSAVPLGGQRGDVDRGRGRGRGRSEVGGFYSRVPIEEDSFSRGSRIQRDGHDTDSRGRGFGYTGRSFDDMSTSSSSHGEFSRSMSTENWRMSRKYEDNEGSWRKPSQRSTSRRWREPWEKSSDGDRERMMDRRMSEDSYRDRSVPSYRRSVSSNSAYDEESDLPEWSTDDVDDIGTFDSSGAFMSFKELEQQEKKERKSQEADNQRDEEEADGNVLAMEKANPLQESVVNESEAETITCGTATAGSDTLDQDVPTQKEQQILVEASSSDHACAEVDDLPTVPEVPNANGAPDGVGQQLGDGAVSSDKLAMEGGLTLAAEPGSNCACGVGEGQEAEVNFDHLELQVENLYASMSADEEPMSIKEKGFLPLDHEDAKKWFYRDPQGQVQGPFSSSEMAEWFSAGYFSMNLVVKQGADECFVPLGELIKKMGSVPFIAAAPVKVSPPQSNNASEMQHHQDQLKLLLLQQQQQQQLQQQLRNVQTQEAFAKLTPQQQQLLLQMMLKQQLNPQVPAAPVSQQKTNALNRSTLLETMNAFQRLSSTVSSHPSTSVPPSFHRSMSQPSGIDVSALPSSLLYGLSTSSASSAAGTASNLPSVGMQASGSLWRSSSCMPSASGQAWLSESGAGGLWNVELPKAITASALEEMQYMVLEKAHQQQHQQQVPTPVAMPGHQLKLQELLEARAGAEKQRDANGAMGLDQLRELLQQQKQQMDIVRLAEEQRRLLEEKRRMLEMNPLERQRLVRQDRSEELYRQQQQLDVLCRLQNDQVASSLQDRDALDVRQLLALQQSWASSHNRGHVVPSGSGLVTSSAAALFHHKDTSSTSSSSSATAASIIQQELINKHLKLNDMKSAMNQWPVTSGASANRWANEPSTWTGSILPPSKSSPLNWETAAAVSANNKSINASMPYVPGGLSSQMKQEYVQKVHKSKEELTQWCENVLKSMLTCSSMDIPTFICHLMDLSSAAEVNQFVQAYLGDTDDAKKFVKQFVEKQNRIQQEALLMQYMSSQGGNQW